MINQHKGNPVADPKKALSFVSHRLTEGAFISIFTFAMFVLLALVTYHSSDPGVNHVTSSMKPIANSGGRVGAYLSDFLYFSFGYLAYLVPVGFAYLAWMLLREHRSVHTLNKSILLVRALGLIFLLSGGCGLLALGLHGRTLGTIHAPGGLLGYALALFLKQALNLEGAAMVLFSMLMVGVTWLTGLSWVRVARFVTIDAFMGIRQASKKSKSFEVARARVDKKVRSVKSEKLLVEVEPPAPVVFKSKAKKNALVSGALPSLQLLDVNQSPHNKGGQSHEELEAVSRNLEQHLLDFGIQVDVVAVHPGPVITRFELQLAAGIKASKLTALAKDLARSLSVPSVRVVEIIPGKTVVGIELPNQNRGMVCLSDVLSKDIYQQAHSPLTLALGVDIAGHPMVVDLAKMPHLLVAGTTGSGKSVGINAMILSLLFKATPEEVRLIMVDPKMLELSVYDGIPHLLTPVVTDMKEAASALRWCVAEMERRYRLMASVGVRNLAGYNEKVNEARAKGEALLDPTFKPNELVGSQAPELEPLPYVVVIIDELADMMMVVGKKVEQLIARIAQKARASGIHLVLATQRPSVDVLTGLIKSNIPTRISFQVSSKIDSRTILDQQGAEQLLGHGDMLFLAPGTGNPLRVHGAFVDDKEVHRIADDWRARGKPEYIEEITQQAGDGLDFGFSEESEQVEDSDPLYDEACEFVFQTRKASISAVQRRFKIGYNRAARLVEEMERTGLVGPLEGGARDVLVETST